MDAEYERHGRLFWRPPAGPDPPALRSTGLQDDHCDDPILVVRDRDMSIADAELRELALELCAELQCRLAHRAARAADVFVRDADEAGAERLHERFLHRERL